MSTVGNINSAFNARKGGAIEAAYAIRACLVDHCIFNKTIIAFLAFACLRFVGLRSLHVMY